MTTILAELNNEKYCLVKVPKDADNFRIGNISGDLYFSHGIECFEVLPKANKKHKWIIIGLAKDLIEEYHRRVDSGRYLDKLSLPEWLKSVGADETFLILKEDKP